MYVHIYWFVVKCTMSPTLILCGGSFLLLILLICHISYAVCDVHFLIKIFNFILSCTLFNGHFTASKLYSSFVIYLPKIIMFQYKRHVRVSRFLVLKKENKDSSSPSSTHITVNCSKIERELSDPEVWSPLWIMRRSQQSNKPGLAVKDSIGAQMRGSGAEQESSSESRKKKQACTWSKEKDSVTI